MPASICGAGSAADVSFSFCILGSTGLLQRLFLVSIKLVKSRNTDLFFHYREDRVAGTFGWEAAGSESERKFQIQILGK